MKYSLIRRRYLIWVVIANCIARAKLHGWQDTYVFTKAMGEMVINSMRGEIPVVTIRPSVIESTWRDPFPGWMEGNRYQYIHVYLQ